jgi:hypothetical protein
VYSFGVLLLELVTGKRPTDPSFLRKGLNIVGWVRPTYHLFCCFFASSKALAIPTMNPSHLTSFTEFFINTNFILIIALLYQLNMLTGEHRLEEIVDGRCDNVEVETVEAVLDIAAMCTDANPDRRPSMNRVLKMLEEEILSPCVSESYYPHLDI